MLNFADADHPLLQDEAMSGDELAEPGPEGGAKGQPSSARAASSLDEVAELLRGSEEPPELTGTAITAPLAPLLSPHAPKPEPVTSPIEPVAQDAELPSPRARDSKGEDRPHRRSSRDRSDRERERERERSKRTSKRRSQSSSRRRGSKCVLSCVLCMLCCAQCMLCVL